MNGCVVTISQSDVHTWILCLQNTELRSILLYYYTNPFWLSVWENILMCVHWCPHTMKCVVRPLYLCEFTNLSVTTFSSLSNCESNTYSALWCSQLRH